MELSTFTLTRRLGDHTPILIRLLGDIQWSGDEQATAMRKLITDVEETRAQGGYFLGFGDYGDFASPSNRQRLDGAALYDTAKSVLDKTALELTRDLYLRAFRKTEKRWVGLLHGHHWYRLQSGIITDQHLCEWLKAPFLGTCAAVRIQIVTGVTSRCNVTLWVHHGCGGGGKQGSPIGKLENLAPYWGGFDVFAMGHTTKSPAAPINRVYPRWHGNGAPDLIHKKILLINTGGYSKAYVEGVRQGNAPMGGYAEKGMMNPSVIGSPVLKITPRLKDTGDGPTRRREWAPEITVEI